jgi:hypothetical protein
MQDEYTEELRQYVDVLEATQSMESAKAELEGLLSVTDSLEAIKNHLDQHGIVDQAHHHSLVMSLENLSAGSGFTATDIVPSLEGFSQGTVSTESLTTRLNDLWKRLVAAIINVMKYIRNFFSRMFSYRAVLRHGAESLLKRASARGMVNPKTPHLELGAEARSFYQGGRLLTDPDSIARAISSMLDQYKALTDLYIPRMLDIGKQFEQVLNKNSGGTQTLIDTCKIFDKLPVAEIASKTRAVVYRDSRFGRRMTMAAPPLLGGWNLYFLMLEPDMQAKIETDPLVYAAALRTTGIRFALTNNSVNQINNAVVNTAGGLQVQTIARKVIDILDLIDKQESSMPINRIEMQVKSLLKSADRYRSSSDGQSTYDESVLRFARSYASWSYGPIDTMTSNMLVISRNLLTYGRKSLNV